MTPPQLPFPIESGWDYILTQADRDGFNPRLCTDEYWAHEMNGWAAVATKGLFFDRCFYRRRKPASGWVRVTKDSLPEPNKPFWGGDTYGQLCFVKGINHPDDLIARGLTRWRYCEGSFQIPPPPEPEREAWEVAFEAADKEAQSKLVGPTADCWAFTAGERKASFKAGWDAKEKEAK